MSCRDCEGLGCGECRDSATDRCLRCEEPIDGDNGEPCRERFGRTDVCCVCALDAELRTVPEAGKAAEHEARVARLRVQTLRMLADLSESGPEGTAAAVRVLEQLRDDGDQAARMSLRAEARRRERGAA